MTNKPVSAVGLLQKLSNTESASDVNKSIDIFQLIQRKEQQLNQKDKSGETKVIPKTASEDLTKSLLVRYRNIADIINKKVTKQKKQSNKASKTIQTSNTIKEFEDYLNYKYPFIERIRKEKFDIILKQRIKDLIEESKT